MIVTLRVDVPVEALDEDAGQELYELVQGYVTALYREETTDDG